MPQFSGSGSRTLNDDILAAVISGWLMSPHLGYAATAVDIMNEIATLKSATLPGDTTELEANIVGILKLTNQDTVYAKADEISALIV